MPSVRYEAPQSVNAAVELLNENANPGAPLHQVLAGGTDVLVRLKSRQSDQPLVLVDIKKIVETQQIDIGPSSITIGAAVSGVRLSSDSILTALLPGVVEAVDLIGSSQIQGRASLGGNLCNASPAADSVPAMIAAGAICVIAGSSGLREVSMDDFCTGPGQNCLQASEFLLQIRFPRPSSATSTAYLRFIPRTEMDIAVVGAGVQITLDSQQRVSTAKVVLGAVAPTAIVCHAAAQAMKGTSLDQQTQTVIAAAASAAAKPISDMRAPAEYRRHVVGVLSKRAALIAYNRAVANLQGKS